MVYEPPLHRAVIEGNVSMVRSLRQNPQNERVRNHLGFTPPELAFMLGREQIVELLQPSPLRSIRVRLTTGEHILISESDFQTRFGVKYCSHLLFRDYAFLRRVIAECPLLLKLGPRAEEARNKGLYFSRHLFSGVVGNVFIAWVSREIGYGLFAASPLAKGSYIGEFVGLVRRLYRLHPDPNPYCFHYPTRFCSLRYMVIDALQTGNETRFINHGNRPNLSPLWVVNRNLLHLLFFANTDIAEGSELTYDYGPDFWRNRTPIF